MRRRSGVRLSVGANAARKIMAIGCGVPSAVVAGMVLWIIFHLMYESVAEGPFDLWGELVPHIVVGIVFLLGVYVLGAVVYLMLGMIRYAGFLDGRMLGERLRFRTRWVGLATAEIDASYDPGRGGVQLLIARVPGGVEVKLPVSQGPESLPAAELTALADAITSGRVPRGEDDRAFLVADQLRQLATDSTSGRSIARIGPDAMPQMAHVEEPPPSHPTPATSSETEIGAGTPGPRSGPRRPPPAEPAECRPAPRGRT